MAIPSFFRSARFVRLLALALPLSLFSHPNHFAARIMPLRVAAQSAPTPSAPEVRDDARLSVTIVDAKLGQPTPVRVRVTNENAEPLGLGKLPYFPNNPAASVARMASPGSVVGLPPEAIGLMYGQNDSAQGYAFQPDGAFYVNGAFDMRLPAGNWTLTISKGYEFVGETETLVVRPGDHLVRSYKLRRWIDMPERGWYSADDHIHLRRSPREDPVIRDWIAAEDVHVGIILQMGDARTTYFPQYAWGKRGRHETGAYILLSGQEEPRTNELGHTISIGADEFVRFKDDYYSYDRVFDRVHERGGLTGYAHQAMFAGGHRGITLDVLDGKIDFMELMQFCASAGPLALQHYYRVLDLGYPLTALAGSDFPWCGRLPPFCDEYTGPRIGDARFYTHTGGSLSFDGWLRGVTAGNTFVTTGPMLEFRVNGKLPGSRLDVVPGAKLRVMAKAYGHASQIPLRHLQIIAHGEVLAQATAGELRQTSGQLSVDLDLGVEHGIWIAARADAGPTQMAHTTPVYVTVGGDGFHNRSNLASQIDRSQEYLQEIRRELIDPAPVRGKEVHPIRTVGLSPAARARLEQRVAAAEKTLEKLRHQR